MLHRHFGSKTLTLTISSTSREGIREVLTKFEHDAVEVLSYEMKTHHHTTGDTYTATMGIKVKRDQYRSRFYPMSLITEFDGITVDNVE
jgi:hypothetical protein